MCNIQQEDQKLRLPKEASFPTERHYVLHHKQQHSSALLSYILVR